MKKAVLFISMFLILVMIFSNRANAQQYKLKQVTTTDYARIENTIYVKAMRQRIESGAVMGMGGTLVTILQCDLKRTLLLDTVRKLYLIEPFGAGRMENPVKVEKEPIPAKEDKTRKGGTITIWYNLHDTGERKKMFGFTARHIWSDQKMKPSPDACSMKDSMMMYTDGWYIDLPEFDCPMDHETFTGGYNPEEVCQDKMVMHESGKAKMGFPLYATITMTMRGNTMVTKIETLDLSTAKLDSLLFTIPPGYSQAKNKEEMMASIGISEMMDKNMKNQNKDEPSMVSKETKMPGTVRIGVYIPSGNDEIEATEVRAHIISSITTSDVEAIAIASEEEAKRYKCDYTLTTTYSSIKSATKVTNVLKAIKRADPNVVYTYAVQGNMTLTSVNDGTVKKQQTMDGKYDGKINDAAGKAVDEGWNQMKKLLRM
jgi:hypothetical protein